MKAKNNPRSSAEARDLLVAPACETCGSPTRLIGVENQVSGGKLSTYLCEACREYQPSVIARAPTSRARAQKRPASKPIEAMDRRDYTPLLCPICPTCSRIMQLSKITPDDRYDHIEVRTYACECGAEIFQTVETSSAP